MHTLKANNSAISKLCKTHKVKTLYAFGSVLTDKFNEKSDIDLIVDFQVIDVLDYADNYFDLKFSLENILKRPIDLLEDKAIKNPYFRENVNLCFLILPFEMRSLAFDWLSYQTYHSLYLLPIQCHSWLPSFLRYYRLFL